MPIYEEKNVSGQPTKETAERDQIVMDLAKLIIDEIELGSTSTEATVLKAMRLARLIVDEEMMSWLGNEVHGYGSDEVSLKYMGYTGRWTNQEKHLGYWGSIGEIEANLASNQQLLQVYRIPDLNFAPSSSNQYERVSDAAAGMNLNMMQIITTAKNAADAVRTLGGIRAKVKSLIHKFVVPVYYERLFSSYSDKIFEGYRAEVDNLIARDAGDVLSKIPWVYDRLSENDTEAVSQALNSCRRIIDSFADAVFPPTDCTVIIDSNELSLGPQRHQNRINAFISQRIDSASRAKRLRQTLSNLYLRVSAGVHSDVTPQEARSLFLQTYLFLGEVLTLPSLGDSGAT